MAAPRVVIAAVSGALAGAAAVAPLVIDFEGWERKVSPDPIGIPTGCAGVTAGMKPGQTFTDEQCVALTAAALAKHGAEIAPCLPAEVPVDTRGAFISFAYNVGTGAFCKSTLAKKAQAGDLVGACAELSRWTYAGGKQWPGLIRRRAAERALCEKGLRS